MKKRKEPVIPTKKFVIEKRNVQDDEDEIEREIQRQLEAKKQSPLRSAPAPVVQTEERKTYSNQAHNQSPESSKKVVKKRIVKMMKDGQLVAEKEEILDEEGNVLKTQIRREGASE